MIYGAIALIPSLFHHSSHSGFDFGKAGGFSVSMRYADYVSVEKPELGVFAE